MEEEDKVNQKLVCFKADFSNLQDRKRFCESGTVYVCSWGRCSAGVASRVVPVADRHVLSLNISNTTRVHQERIGQKRV